MFDGFFDPGAPRSAALACLVGIMVATLAAEPADAQGYHRPKTSEKARKVKSPPAPPGPHIFIVSLKSQRGALYANGQLVAHTPISSGTASHPTPTGIFSVIQKNRHHRSNIYSGAPMPYMQRLTWSGIALHQGQLPGYPASHGCIRLPADFANFLWRTTRLGARVIVTHDEIEPSDIAHAKLFQPKPRIDLAESSQLRRSIETEVAVNTIVSSATDATGTAERAEPETETAKFAPAVTDMSAAAQHDIPAPILASFFNTLDAKAKKPAPAGPVSIFISRKDKQLYVRQGFQALFNVPIAFPDEKTLGTHVFTALDRTDGAGGLRWIAMAMPGTPQAGHEIAAPERKVVYRYDDFGRRIPVRVKKHAAAAPVEPARSAPNASEVLDRIELPQDVVDRVAEYVTVGATLIVSDHGLSHETGAYTDFIVLTR